MKTALIAFSLLFSAVTANAGSLPSWDAIPITTKELIIKQYISGYMAGMNQGITEGIKSVISYTKKTGENTYIDAKPNTYTTCSNLVSSNMDRIYDDTHGWQQIQPRGTKHYIDEMTAFLKKYPDCNKSDVSELIEILTPIWLNVETKSSYDDVGRGCSK